MGRPVAARGVRLDAHQHYWIYDPHQHTWMNAEMGVLKADFLPADLAPQLEAIGFDGTIAVQARQILAETEWLLALAERHELIRGVVGWVDLCSPAVGEELARFGAHPKLVGVRHVVHDEPDDAFMLREDFQRGIAQLHEHDLCYDLLLYPRHLPVALELVKRFPEQPFVIDHLAKPVIREGKISPWREDLRALAAFERVSCKLSGMVTEADWGRWEEADYGSYLDIALEAFGPERLMIGSDWPVCTLAADYAEVMAIVSEYVERLGAGEREAILGGSCARIYGIDPQAS